MPPRPFKVCSDVNFVADGETFYWDNSKGDKDCHIHVVDKGVLTQQDYDVPAHGKTSATVDPQAQDGEYDYTCKCKGLGAVGNPKIIIGN